MTTSQLPLLPAVRASQVPCLTGTMKVGWASLLMLADEGCCPACPPGADLGRAAAMPPFGDKDSSELILSCSVNACPACACSESAVSLDPVKQHRRGGCSALKVLSDSACHTTSRTCMSQALPFKGPNTCDACSTHCIMAQTNPVKA